MIEMIWGDSNDPPINERVFRIKHIDMLVMATDLPYNADGITLTTYEHKNVLMRCHKKHLDHLFSIKEYHDELMSEFTDNIIKSLIDKGCLVIIKAPDDEFLIATEVGRTVISGLVGSMGLSEDEFNFLAYLIDSSHPLKLEERYENDELEIIENSEDA